MFPQSARRLRKGIENGKPSGLGSASRHGPEYEKTRSDGGPQSFSWYSPIDLRLFDPAFRSLHESLRISGDRKTCAPAQNVSMVETRSAMAELSLAQDAGEASAANVDMLRNAHESITPADLRLKMPKCMQTHAAVFRTGDVLKEKCHQTGDMFHQSNNVKTQDFPNAKNSTTNAILQSAWVEDPSNNCRGDQVDSLPKFTAAAAEVCKGAKPKKKRGPERLDIYHCHVCGCGPMSGAKTFEMHRLGKTHQALLGENPGRFVSPSPPVTSAEPEAEEPPAPTLVTLERIDWFSDPTGNAKLEPVTVLMEGLTVAEKPAVSEEQKIVSYMTEDGVLEQVELEYSVETVCTAIGKKSKPKKRKGPMLDLRTMRIRSTGASVKAINGFGTNGTWMPTISSDTSWTVQHGDDHLEEAVDKEEAVHDRGWRQSTSKVRKERQWLRSQTDQEVRTRADSLRLPRMNPVKKGKAQKRLATAKRGLSFYSDDFA